MTDKRGKQVHWTVWFNRRPTSPTPCHPLRNESFQILGRSTPYTQCTVHTALEWKERKREKKKLMERGDREKPHPPTLFLYTVLLLHCAYSRIDSLFISPSSLLSFFFPFRLSLTSISFIWLDSTAQGAAHPPPPTHPSDSRAQP